MAGQKRKLNIPMYEIYDEEVVEEGIGFDDEDIIDAEVINPGPTMGERPRERAAQGAQGASRGARRAAQAAARTARRVRENGAWDTFFRQRGDAAKTALGVDDERVSSRGRLTSTPTAATNTAATPAIAEMPAGVHHLRCREGSGLWPGLRAGSAAEASGW